MLDNRAHRRNENYSGNVFAKRFAWAFLAPLFRLSPRPFYGFRNFLLRIMGAKLGREPRFYPSVEIAFPWNLETGDWVTVGPHVQLYSLGTIRLGADVMISQNAHICAGTHDLSKPNLPLQRPPVRIGNGTWICADAFVGPDVTVGRGCVIGARAVVVKDVPDGTIVAGNPARAIGEWRVGLEDSAGKG